MRVTKRVRLEDLALELSLIPQRISDAVSVTLGQPWLEASAKSFCPVDTGALMGSIRTERRGPHAIALVAGGTGYINPRTGRPVDYARHVHDGTSRVPARPFLLQAVIMERLRYLREILRRAGEAI
jgi:hypothetical protein